MERFENCVGRRRGAAGLRTDGTLDRAAEETADPAVSSAIATWIAPRTAGTVSLAVALRDSRGGLDAVVISLAVIGP
ncbi:MAG TPA: hypothetical protein VMT03_13915 [Polyangia bacterium]|nr:hypothetical protein [Polyangia bacterium]